jgi:hypothetical protein
VVNVPPSLSQAPCNGGSAKKKEPTALSGGRDPAGRHNTPNVRAHLYQSEQHATTDDLRRNAIASVELVGSTAATRWHQSRPQTS